MTPEPAKAGDLTPIKALLEAAALPHDDVTEALLPDFLVLRSRAALAGSAACERHGTDGLLRSVAVNEALRGKGLGAVLVDAIETRARGLGLRSLYLLTTTAADFFAHRGYQRIDRREAPPPIQATREFTTLCPASAICMKKDLART